MIVTFKTEPGYFEQEKDGRKNNTVRRIDPEDLRFKAMDRGLVDKIQIVSCGNIENNFIREVTDITFWEGLAIITWRHEEDE